MTSVSVATDLCSNLEKLLSNFKVYFSTIAPTLVKWLREEKNIDVTEREINEILTIIPMSPPSTPIKSLKSSVMKPSKDDGTQCMYQIKRGKKNLGKRCTGRCYDNTGYCQSCKKKKSVKKLLENNEILYKTKESQNDESITKVDLEEIIGRPGYYLEKSNNFVIFGERTVIRVLENGKERPLTVEEVNKAKALGLIVDENFNEEQIQLEDLSDDEEEISIQ